jgi:hypothetical protein
MEGNISDGSSPVICKGRRRVVERVGRRIPTNFISRITRSQVQREDDTEAKNA